MHIFKWLLIFMPLLPLSVAAQFNYTFQNDIPVNQNSSDLVQPFSGGFIAPQFSSIDLNLDGTMDLFVFDRASSKVSTFLLIDTAYVYSPEYESLFPAGLKNWVLLRDFNCDGKMDLFTSSIFGMSLYENTSIIQLDWTLKYQTIFTEGSNGQINLQVSGLDLPAIGDVDNDGDIDILSFNFATGGGVEFHKNMSVENTGSCAMDLVRTTRRYGDFEECTCENYIFGTEDCTTGGREEHSGGKTILSFHQTNSQTQDLVIGQEYCIFPGFLPNEGSVDEAKMNQVSFDFPNQQDALRMEFPAFFEIDLFNDKKLDLLAAPNVYFNDGTLDYEGLSFLYEKDNQGNYNLISSNFLKSEMVDVGRKAPPVFTDLDFDGDEDMLIGTGKNVDGAAIWMYENTGTVMIPSFKLVTKDYLGLRVDGAASIRIQMFDVDGDDLDDLILFKVINNQLIAEAFLHSGNPIEPYNLQNKVPLSLPEATIWDVPHYFNLGTATGLLIGRQAGNLAYYNTQDNLTTAEWDEISTSYLGIEENAKKRNLQAIVMDANGNGIQDMFTINDSREVLMYENFLQNNNPQEVKGFNDETNQSFNLGFGNLANPTAANLYGTLEPTLVFGLLQGGLNVLKNTKNTDGGNLVKLKVVVFPNPAENNLVQFQSNKNGKLRIIDASGKVVVEPFNVLAGEQINLQLFLEAGIYFVEMVSNNSEKEVTRIVISD